MTCLITLKNYRGRKVRKLFLKLENLVNALTDFGAVLGGALVGIMAAIVSYAVIARYLFNRPVGWSEEISIYLMIWAIFLGAAYTLKHNGHIGVDLLLSNLSNRLKLIFHGLHYVTGTILMSVLFYKGIELIQLSLMLENRSLDLNFPIFIAQLSIPVGAALLILQMIVKFLGLFFHRKTPQH